MYNYTIYRDGLWAGGGGEGTRRLDLGARELGGVALERKPLGHVATLDVDSVALSETLGESRDERRGDELEHSLEERALEDVGEERRSFGLQTYEESDGC